MPDNPHIRKECGRRGIRIIAIGRCYRLLGLGVDILTADLRTIRESDLLRVLG